MAANDKYSDLLDTELCSLKQIICNWLKLTTIQICPKRAKKSSATETGLLKTTTIQNCSTLNFAPQKLNDHLKLVEINDYSDLPDTELCSWEA